MGCGRAIHLLVRFPGWFRDRSQNRPSRLSRQRGLPTLVEMRFTRVVSRSMHGSGTHAPCMANPSCPPARCHRCPGRHSSTAVPARSRRRRRRCPCRPRTSHDPDLRSCCTRRLWGRRAGRSRRRPRKARRDRPLGRN